LAHQRQFHQFRVALAALLAAPLLRQVALVVRAEAQPYPIHLVELILLAAAPGQVHLPPHQSAPQLRALAAQVQISTGETEEPQPRPQPLTA
jgi:hypothetical protein